MRKDANSRITGGIPLGTGLLIGGDPGAIAFGMATLAVLLCVQAVTAIGSAKRCRARRWGTA